MKLLCVLLLTFTTSVGMAQGDLIYLRANTYLEYYRQHPFNCDSLKDDEVNSFTDRICANLRLQRSDSLLKDRYDQVVVELERSGNDTLLRSFEALQQAWREFRDRHCKTRVGEITGNGSAAEYMNEMRELTEMRIEELERLLARYRSD